MLETEIVMNCVPTALLATKIDKYVPLTSYPSKKSKAVLKCVAVIVVWRGLNFNLI